MTDDPTFRSLAPFGCYRVLGVAPWMSEETRDRRFAERFRRARRDPDAPDSHEALNEARGWFSEPDKDALRRFWTFPLGLRPDDAAFGALGLQAEQEAAMREALAEAMARWL